VAQSSSLYLAGFEATAIAIAYVLHDLGHHPEHQDTIYNEIQTQLSGKELTMDLINGLSFLDSVVIESLRLHPSLPIIDRITTRDYEVTVYTSFIYSVNENQLKKIQFIANVYF